MPLSDRASNLDNLSIVSELARNFQALLSPPEIEIPIRDTVIRSESSGLPDGSVKDPLYNVPLGETLDKAIARMSREAYAAWEEWVNPDQEPKLSMNGQEIVPLNRTIEEAMLTAEEQVAYTRIRRLQKVEEILYGRTQLSIMQRAIEEVAGLNRHDIEDVPLQNRYFIKTEVTKDEFGASQKVLTKVDRCAGKPEINKVKGIQVSAVTQSRFNPSLSERLDLMIMTAFQTEKWREPARSEEKKYIPNITPKDDPDFIPPSDIKSRNFVIYPPASRAYNMVFKVTYPNGNIRKVYPKIAKDYTSLSSMKYMLDQKKVVYSSVELDVVKEKLREFPNCRFEIDLRVTYGPDFEPDPNSYKKVDPDTRLGKKLLQLLNDQPNLFDEFVWTYEEIDEDGKPQTVKKLAVGYKVQDPRDTIGPRIYWVYIDEKSNTIISPSDKKQILLTSLPSFLRARKIAPQYLYFPLKYYTQDDPNYVKKDHPFLAVVRVSDNYSYYDRKAKTLVEFDEVVKHFTSILNSKGYNLYSTVPESKFSTVVLYKFIHKDASTKQQRKTLFSTLTSHVRT